MIDCEGPLFEVRVSADGKTLWVDGGDGSCIGRFSKTFGIDVHKTAAEQMAGGSQCLFCTHEAAGQREFEVFRAQMLAHHGIEVPADALNF